MLDIENCKQTFRNRKRPPISLLVSSLDHRRQMPTLRLHTVCFKHTAMSRKCYWGLGEDPGGKVLAMKMLGPEFISSMFTEKARQGGMSLFPALTR